MNLDYQQTSQKISTWINEAVHESSFQKIIIALSGGIDSSLSCALAVKALGIENVYCLLLPCGNLNPHSLSDSLLVAKHLAIPEKQIIKIDIKNAVDAILSNLSDVTDIRRGNIMARVRMIYLFDQAKKLNVLVCGTENKSEHLLGYFTRFGDEASDIEPIRCLYKTQVWEMARHLGLPSEIINKPPTAGLWQNQTDENELGFSYLDADKILAMKFDECLSTEEIVKRGMNKNLIKKVLNRVSQNDFKHHLPKICKL